MRKVVLFGALAFSFSAAVFACTEDSPILVIGPETGAGSTTSSGGTSGGSSGTDPNDADTTDSPSDIPDASIADAPDPDVIVKDAGPGVIDASGCMTCDCDLDGVNRPGCGDDAGTDCDDNDTRYRTNQGFLDLKPPAGKTGDWNCVGGAEKFYPENVNCGTLSLTTCEGAQGFNAAVGCGEEGQYVTCKPVILGLLCQVGTTEVRKQACR